MDPADEPGSVTGEMGDASSGSALPAPGEVPPPRHRVTRFFSRSRELWRVVYRDPEHVPERPAEQQQRRQRQQVSLDYPLLLGEAAVQARPDRRQRDVDDRLVEEHDPRPEDARDEDSALDRRVARGPSPLWRPGPSSAHTRRT